MTRPLRLSALAAALLLASCSVQRVDESAQRAENDAAMASQYAALLRNQQQQPKRETVVFSDKPWVSTQPVVAKRGMPSALDCELSYRPSGSVGITEIAQYITSQCGIAVLVSPDALNPTAGTTSPQPASTAPAPIDNPSPDSLAGLLPAGLITNPATMGAASSSGSGYRASDFTSLASGSQVSGLKYSGKASGLLDEVTARLGLGWRYSPVERAVRISYFETRVFDVWSFGDKQVIASTVKSGMATAAGTSGSNSGGSSTSSGVSGDSGSNQSTTVTLESSILQDIQNNVKAMLSVAPAGRMYLAPSTGTLTVTDPRQRLDQRAAGLAGLLFPAGGGETPSDPGHLGQGRRDLRRTPGHSPKEEALIELCSQEKALGRKVLAYTVYSGTRDTTSRLKRLLEQAGLKVAILRASVDTARREDWILDQVDRGVDVLITNPELVKTGLDLLDLPTIVFLQTGYNVYTLQQAARRSWRIGQKQAVRVLFFGYAGSSQITCLQLMAKKIAVAQSTSGDVPESGLDALNQNGDSVEMALARQLLSG